MTHHIHTIGQPISEWWYTCVVTDPQGRRHTFLVPTIESATALSLAFEACGGMAPVDCIRVDAIETLASEADEEDSTLGGDTPVTQSRLHSLPPSASMFARIDAALHDAAPRAMSVDELAVTIGSPADEFEHLCRAMVPADLEQVALIAYRPITGRMMAAA
jgi:hypothetical protein